MVKSVKAAVQQEGVECDITTRKSKLGNMILQIPNKEQADNLADVLRRRLGKNIGVRRPSPSVLLVLIGIEDSVDEAELQSALAAFDTELQVIGEFHIREGANGVRTAVIRVPLGPGLRLIRKKRLKVGWAQCRIKEIDTENKGCAKCSEKGHTAKDCTGVEKRKCFRCKEQGHLIAACSKLSGVHRLGGMENDQPVVAQAAGDNSASCK